MQVKSKRSVRRTNMLKHARIIAPTSSEPIDCMVYDLTDVGAGLRISPGDVVPDCFQLFLGYSRTGRSCRVQWRNNERIGVEFTGEADAVRPSAVLERA